LKLWRELLLPVKAFYPVLVTFYLYFKKMYYLIRVPEKVFISFILFHFVLLTISLFYVIFWFSRAEKATGLPPLK